MGQREAVRRFLWQRMPRAICDACVGDYLSLSRRQVTAARNGIRLSAGLATLTGQCSGCCTTRAVTLLAPTEAR